MASELGKSLGAIVAKHMGLKNVLEASIVMKPDSVLYLSATICIDGEELRGALREFLGDGHCPETQFPGGQENSR